MKLEPNYRDGWELVKGFPVVVDETYVVDGYVYYVDSNGIPGQVWRKKLGPVDNTTDRLP